MPIGGGGGGSNRCYARVNWRDSIEGDKTAKSDCWLMLCPRAPAKAKASKLLRLRLRITNCKDN